ncbi:MAG: DUF1295 domain-containing protein [Candidatus Saccharimonadales bacterium]
MELIALALAVLVYVTVIFGIAWKIGRLDIIDVAWGGAFIVIALGSFMFGSRGILQMITTGLVCVWGARLAYYIFRRIKVSTKEDPRYTQMRSKWKGSQVVNAYLRVFLVQGMLAAIISASVVTINLSESSGLTSWVYIGVGVWLVGFLFEAIGDAQLRRHLANPTKKGMLMTSGLWRYTRHPNYFGEATLWWGIWLISLVVPLGWVTIVGPITITYLLLFVSGVPLTEKRFAGRPGWADYRKRTSKFLPLPPKRV